MSDFSWSYSAYSSAVQCLRKFKYCYIDKIVPEGPDSGDLIFGSALHSAINACLTGEDGQATFQLYWMTYKDKDVEYGRYKWEELAKIGAEFIRKFTKYHAEKYRFLYGEERAYAKYKGVQLEGTLDFLGTYSGRRSLRDFKTSGSNYKPEKQKTALQLYLYSYLSIKNGFEVPETLGYTVFNKGTGSIQDLTWEFKESEMYRALDEMVDYMTVLQERRADLPDSSHLYPKNYNACLDYSRKCQYYNLCHGDNNGPSSKKEA